MKSWRRHRAPPLLRARGCAGPVPLGVRANKNCIWRVPHPRGDIVLLGDSNAGQFTEPVTRAGNRAGYDVTVATNSSCPYLGLRIKRIDGEERLCPTFGSKSIDYIVRTKPSLVVLATRTDFYLQNPDDGLGLVGKGGLTFSDAGKARLWRQALRSTLLRLNNAGVPVLLVHPIPVLPLDQATCAIVRILLGECASSLPRSSVDRWLRLAIKTENAGARRREANLDPRLREPALQQEPLRDSEEQGLALPRLAPPQHRRRPHLDRHVPAGDCRARGAAGVKSSADSERLTSR